MVHRSARLALLGGLMGLLWGGCGSSSAGDGGSGGGGAGGGAGDVDAGPVDAGWPRDPLDDGGTFPPGDLCGRAIAVDFQAGDGGASALLRVDLRAYADQYRLGCATSAAAGAADAVFQVTLTEPRSLQVVAADGGDAVLGLNAAPCAFAPLLACQDKGGLEGETLSLARLEAGTYFVFLDGDGPAQGESAVTFSLGAPAPAPANDSCASAQALPFTNGRASASGTTVGADNSSAATQSQCVANDSYAGDVVYRFELAQPQDVTLTATAGATGDLAPLTSVRRACDSRTQAEELRCALGASPYTLRNLPAGAYFLWVDGQGSTSGSFELSLTLAPPSRTPTNDSCAAPVQLTPGDSSTTVLADANRDYHLSCAPAGSGGDTVFSFTTTQASKVTVTATPGPSDKVALSLRADPCASGATLECANDGATGAPVSVITRNLPAGTYAAVVQNEEGRGVDPVGVLLTLGPPVLPPPNDLCASPQPIAPGTSLVADLSGATRQLTPSCVASAAGGEAFYGFTLTSPRRVTVTATPGPADDVVLQLLPATCAATSLACVNAGFAGTVETLVAANLPPGDYVLAVSTRGAFAAASVGLTFTATAPVSPPPNDTCAGVVTLAPGVSQTVDLSAAARNFAGTSCPYRPTGPDAVYAFTLASPQNATLILSPGMNDDVGLLLTGSPCGTGSELSCTDGARAGNAERRVARGLLPGTYYAVPYAFSPNDTSAPLGLSLTLTPSQPPPNETCATAQGVAFTNNVATVTVDLSDAAKDYSAPCGAAASGGDAVYAVTVPPAQTLSVVVTPGPALDPLLFIRASPCATGAQLSCRDTGLVGDPETATLTNSSAANATYFVFVQGYDPVMSATASITFTLQ